MVAFTSAALLSLAAIGALAAPAKEKRTGLWRHRSQCMSTSEAQVVATNWGTLIANYTDELAIAATAENLVDYSESVNSLINTCPQGAAAQTLPLLAASFSNRAQFMEGQGQQPPINFEQLLIHHDCKSVTIRWKTTNTAPVTPTLASPRPVIGIIILEVVKAPAGSQFPWLIETVYSEFDSAAWLQNLQQAGGICASASPSSPALPLPSGTVGPLASGSAAPAPSGAPVSSPAVSAAPVSAAPSGYTTATSVDTCTETTTSSVVPSATYAA